MSRNPLFRPAPGMERVADAIERIRAHATSVSIVGQGITDDDVKRLTAVLATSDCVTELNLACNRCALVQPCVASEQSGSLSLQDNRRGVQGTGPSSRETQAAETSGLEQQSDRSARFGALRSHTSAPTGNFSVLRRCQPSARRNTTVKHRDVECRRKQHLGANLWRLAGHANAHLRAAVVPGVGEQRGTEMGQRQRCPQT
jgi:hypothetical protein